MTTYGTAFLHYALSLRSTCGPDGINVLDRRDQWVSETKKLDYLLYATIA